jgi:muramidase (phage lysozyme)
MNANRKAFLNAIAYAEGTDPNHPTSINRGYDVIVSGVDGPEIFTDYSAHPFASGRKPKDVNGRGLYSSASGRYQFMRVHWEHYRDQLGLPDFGPESQDRWAIQLIRERRALPDIDSGHFLVAIGKVSNLWASLPGAGYGQPERKLSALENAYEASGGTFA